MGGGQQPPVTPVIWCNGFRLPVCRPASLSMLAQRTGGPTMASAKIDLYQSVTDHIVSTVENLSEDDHLVMPWHRSGLSQLPTNIESGNPYNGINIVSLWVTAVDRGFTSNIWGTYCQWKKAGAQVRKGEKSALVIFYKEYLAEGDDGEKETQRFVRASWAFNVAQVEGYEIPAPEKATDLCPTPRPTSSMGETWPAIGRQPIPSPCRMIGCSLILKPAPGHRTFMGSCCTN